MFSALPAFANPLLDSGIVPGQHTYDRERHRFDADFELFPGAAITPIIGYSRNSYSGPGATTYHVGQDEFRLTQDLRDLDQEIRGGASFQAGPISGQIIQGWRKFQLRREADARAGRGQRQQLRARSSACPFSLTGFNRQTTTDVNTPATSAFVTGRFGPRVRVVGSYSRAQADRRTPTSRKTSRATSSPSRSAASSTALSEPVSSRATATQWTGIGTRRGRDHRRRRLRSQLRAPAPRARRLRARSRASFSTRPPSRGVSTGDLARLLESQTTIDRTEAVYEAGLSARGLGPVSLRGSYSQTNQDLTVTEDPSADRRPRRTGG